MKNKKGFTLFELLVSISIIAILVAVASTSFSAAQKKARDSRRMEDMETVRKAAEQYYMLNSSVYPTSCADGGSWMGPGSQLILASFPKDPKTGSYTKDCTLNSSYCYCATLENLNGNSSNTTCTGWVNGTGQYYCVSNQQ